MRSPRSIGLIVSVQVLANGFAHHAAAQTNAPATTAAHSAKDDSTVIRQLIAEYSRSISAPAGTRPDWSAFRAMFTPEARIEAIVFLGFFYQLMRVPAVIVLGFWFVLQLLDGIASLGATTT